MTGSRGACHFRGKPWSKSEIAIVVYFSSRYICYEALTELLLRRGYHRSPSAIERRVRTIISSNPFLQPSESKWDISAVDCWIDSNLDHDTVNSLIAFNSEDAVVVDEVGT